MGQSEGAYAQNAEREKFAQQERLRSVPGKDWNEKFTNALSLSVGRPFPYPAPTPPAKETPKESIPALSEQQPTQSPIDMNSPEASKYLADFLNQRKPQTYGQYSTEQRKYQDYGSPQG